MTIDLLTHRFVRLAIAAVVVAVTATAASAQQGVTYEVVASFDGIFVNGMSPGTLLEGRDGNLYGTTESRGIFGAGTLFRIDAAGVLTTLHHFGGLQSVRAVVRSSKRPMGVSTAPQKAAAPSVRGPSSGWTRLER